MALTSRHPESSSPGVSSSRSYRRFLAALLLVSFALRVWLASLGGQGFWPDEDRYTDGRLAARYLLHGQWHEAGEELLGHPDHILFRWFSVPPGLYEEWAGPRPAVVAAYFGLFSVLAIYLLWRVARKAGAGEAEALWCAFLAAGANSLFYYSRHFFPYDIALCAMLAALLLALGKATVRNSLLVGAAAGVGFLVYNGYWLLGGCMLILYTLLGAGNGSRFWSRAFWSGTGLVGSILPIVAAGHLLGIDLVAEDYKWGVIAKGDFPFGHRVMGGYLWYGEGGLLLVWLAALAYALWTACRERRFGRLAWYAGGLGLVTAGLLVLSDVIPLFAVQGRRVRCVVPFLCLCAGYGIERFIARRSHARRGWTAAFIGMVLLLAAVNFSGPLRQVFPDQFQRRADRVVRAGNSYDAYRLAFAESLWGLPLDPMLPSSRPLLHDRHPLQFRPYQYEGYDTAQRAEINRHDVTMRLYRIPVDLDRDSAPGTQFPGPVRWSLVFPSDRAGTAEPLVTTGRTGRADFLFVRYIDQRHIAFGLDHWGSGAAISAPIEIDYAKTHEVVISLGSLLPSPDSAWSREDPARDRWRNQVLVVLDGGVVFHWQQEAWPATSRDIFFGINLIGGTAAQLSFSGRVLGLAPAALNEVSGAMRSPVLGALVENSWARAALGPPASHLNSADASPPGQRDLPGRSEHVVGLRFRLPGSEAAARAQPLLSLVRSDGQHGLLAIRGSDQGLALGWRDAAGWSWTDPLPVSASGRHTLVMQWARPDAGSTTPGQGQRRREACLVMLDRVIVPHLHPEYFDAAVERIVAWRDYGPPDKIVAPVFGGQSYPLDPVPALLLPAPGGTPPSRRVHLAALFPTARPNRSEPLLTAGHAGAADSVFVHYEGPGQIRLGFDHWGEGGPVSDPLPVSAGYQTIDVEFGKGTWTHPDGGKIQVWLNGKSILSETSDFYPSDPKELTIGRNQIGLSTSDPEFTGRLFPIEDGAGN